MSRQPRRVAILFPADRLLGLETDVHQSRHAETAAALAAAGVEVVGAPFADQFAEDVRAPLLNSDGVLVWFNPIEAGRNRRVLNTLLRDVASKGVSQHPPSWDRPDRHKRGALPYAAHGVGCDMRLYATRTPCIWNCLRASLPGRGC